MELGYWRRVAEADHRVPGDRRLGDLTAELTTMLGAADPDLRDHTALTTLSTWIGRGVYDDLLAGLGDGMASGLTIGLGGRGDDSVFRRAFSVLILAECVDRDTELALVPPDKVLEWGDRIAGWFVRERDLRGYVPGKGWAHAVAHGADAVAALGRSPHFHRHELTVLLDVIADRLLEPGDRVWSSGEPDRLALATLTVLRRELVPWTVVEPWLRRIAGGTRRPTLDGDVYLRTGNADAYLRALYLQLALAPEPPACRADLMLLIVDVLRESRPDLFGRASGPTGQ